MPGGAQQAIRCRDLNLYYGEFHALKNIDLAIAPRRITALIGPSGCGKSTLLRVFNRMNEVIPGARVTGEVEVFGRPLFGEDVNRLRRKVGMVFQRPNPFPLSVYENVAFGPRVHARTEGLDAVVQQSLEAVDLWTTLRDRLRDDALQLTGEQQQRLCIARLLAVKPEILLMDEPCSALDPIATARIEELMRELQEHYTIIVVTHNMQQAARVSEECGFMLLGELIEFGDTTQIFTAPRSRKTEDYVSGRFG
ncbi:MAG: phosphate ABC transporter ATP-binding protein [Acidobacteria bacterium]|nr:phosphate ABC transporter ATP-binding protein [Acidobacteriota bacterium]